MTKPAAAPVILMHGTNDTAASLAPLATRINREAHLVAVPITYGRHTTSLRGRLGNGGIASMRAAFAEINAQVDEIRANQEVERVHLVGHSQGGLHTLAYARTHPDAVGSVILLGSPVTGVNPAGCATTLLHRRPLRLVLDALLGPSAREQLRGSASLPSSTDLVPDVEYLLIVSKHDRTVRPGGLAAGTLRGLRVIHTDELTDDVVNHAGLARHPAVVEAVVNALVS